jgi:hypothetical protein
MSFRLISLAALAALATGCATAGKPALSAAFDAPAIAEEARPVEKPLMTNHFRTDRASTISDDDLAAILAAPVFLEERSRVGVVPVANQYVADDGVPLLGVPGALRVALEDTGAFSAVSEVSTDFARAPNIGGLRDLAARYRSEYLLLYRHRFVDRTYQNPWAWAYLTGVGVFFAPAHNLEAAGVLEATMFDARSGTILFTVYERIEGLEKHDAFDHERKRRELKEKLLEEATERLTEKVSHHVLALRRADELAKPKKVARAIEPAPTPDIASGEEGDKP